MIRRRPSDPIRGGSSRIRPELILAAWLALTIPAAPVGASSCMPGCLSGSLSDSLDFLGAGPLGQAEVAALVTTLGQGDTLVSIQPARRLIPGSNVKLFTTGCFLKRYGIDYRRPTLLLAKGKASQRKDGTDVRFRGDLVLRASGMPDVYQLIAPGSRGLLDSLAFLLHAGGLARFQGTLWIDGSVFAPESYGPGWAHDDFAYAYGAPVNAILANGNAATLIATSTTKGVTYEFDPPEVSLVARGKPAIGDTGSFGHIDVSRAPGSRVVEVTGMVPRGGMVKRQVAVFDPDSTAGLMLLGAMRRVGIEVDASVRVLRPSSAAGADADRIEGFAASSPAESTASASAWGWTSVDSRRGTGVTSLLSPPAAEIVGIVNAMSLNAEAEAILRLLDPAPVGKRREQGLVELMRIVGESGIDTFDLSLVDGSGLSPQDLVTPRAIVSWLTSLDRDPAIGAAFREGLARPGALGTLKNRFGALDTKAELRGKTGTLTNVSALSGFVTRADGERSIFSILSNGNRSSVAAAREAEEKLVSLLARTGPTTGPTSPPLGIPR